MEALGLAPAEVLPFPQEQLVVVEYPGVVNSVRQAERTLGGVVKVQEASSLASPERDKLLELRFRPDDPFCHPIQGRAVPTSNLVLKVTVKRRRKKRKAQAEQEADEDGEIVDYSTKCVGIVQTTFRFRALADFQYAVSQEDAMWKLRKAFEQGNVDALLSYKLADDDEDQTNLRLIPPPRFSGHLLPQDYRYRANPNAIKVRVVDKDTGQSSLKLVWRQPVQRDIAKYITWNTLSVPTEPTEEIAKVRSKIPRQRLQELQQLFDREPIWTRSYVVNSVSADTSRYLKKLLPCFGYVFKEGAWRDLWIRWGVDPRSDRQYRFYQRLDIRHKGEPVVPQRKGLTRKPSTVDSGSSNASLHKLLVIQGDHKASDSMLNPVYLIKDIVDPQVREYINRPTVLLDECQKNSGWFHPEALHRVRKVVRGKMSDLQAGREPDVHHYASILDADLPQEKEEAPHEGEEDEYDLPSSPSEGESSRPSASVSASVEPRPTSKDANDRVSSLMKQLQKAQVSVQKDEDDIADMTMDDIEEYDDVFGDDDE